MQYKNKILLILVWITISLMSSLALAEDSKTSTTTPSTTTTESSLSIPSDFVAPIPWATKENPFAWIWSFIKSKDSLSEDEYKVLIWIFNDYIRQIKEVHNNTSISQQDKYSKVSEINKAFFVSIKTYVDTTKIESYEKWVAEKTINNWGTSPQPQPKPQPTYSWSTDTNLYSFLKKWADLTSEELKALNETMSYYTKKLASIYADKTKSQDEKIAKSKEVNKAFYAALRKFVYEEKLDAYDKWVEQKLASNNWYPNPTNPQSTDDKNNPKPNNDGNNKPEPKCISQDNKKAELKLKAKIEKAYKVSLEWSDYNPKWEEDLLWYKIVIKNAKWEEKIVSVDEDTTEKDDWNSKAWINIYKVYAITSDWVKHESNSVSIPMNSNWWYDFSLKIQECKSDNQMWNNDSTWMPDVDKIVKDAKKIGPAIVKKIKFQYKYLSEKTRQLVNKKIDSIPKEKREEYINNLIVKIDKLIKVTKSQSLITKLKELKQVLQEKLEELTWDSSDDSIINDLINDNWDTTWWGTVSTQDSSN